MSTDRFTIRTVVVTLAVVVVGGVAAMALLTAVHMAIPDQLDRVINLAAGGLIALLAKTSTASDPPQDVQVVNDSGEPVPREQSPGPPPILRAGDADE